MVQIQHYKCECLLKKKAKTNYIIHTNCMYSLVNFEKEESPNGKGQKNGINLGTIYTGNIQCASPEQQIHTHQLITLKYSFLQSSYIHNNKWAFLFFRTCIEHKIQKCRPTRGSLNQSPFPEPCCPISAFPHCPCALRERDIQRQREERE